MQPLFEDGHPTAAKQQMVATEKLDHFGDIIFLIEDGYVKGWHPPDPFSDKDEPSSKRTNKDRDLCTASRRCKRFQIVKIQCSVAERVQNL